MRNSGWALSRSTGVEGLRKYEKGAGKKNPAQHEKLSRATVLY